MRATGARSIGLLEGVKDRSLSFGRNGRRRRTGYLAGTAALVALGAGAGWWAIGRIPLEPGRVKVMGFMNQTGDAGLDGIGALASDVITRGLTETGAVEVVGSGAGTAIRGRYYRQEEKLQLTAEIADLRSGKVLATIGPESAPVKTPSPALASLRSRVMGSVAMMFDRTYGMQGIALGQPPRYEAYREYLAGEEAFYRGRMDSAETRFRRAVALDSTFHLPLLRIQNAYFVSGRYAQADSALEWLSDLRGSLSPFEAAFLDLWAAIQDYNAAYAAAQTMARVAPHSEFAAYYLAMMAHWSSRWQEAVTIFRRLNPEGGSSGDDSTTTISPAPFICSGSMSASLKPPSAGRDSIRVRAGFWYNRYGLSPLWARWTTSMPWWRRASRSGAK